MKKENLHIGILAAMPEEIGLALKDIKYIEEHKYGDLNIFSGIYKESFNSQDVFLSFAWSGWGKVSASRATTRMLSTKYRDKEIDFMIFSGLAGGINQNSKKWDIIISDAVLQHDIDARPLFPKFVIPSINKIKIIPDEFFVRKIYKHLLNEKNQNNLKGFGSIYKGLIASGDMFISSEEKIKNLRRDFPDLYCVEMEGAAFGQVCHQEKINWLVLRVISDSANESASQDFEAFVQQYKELSWSLIKIIINFITENFII